MWDGIVNGLNHVEEKVVLRSLLKVCSLVSNVRGGFVVSNEKDYDSKGESLSN